MFELFKKINFWIFTACLVFIIIHLILFMLPVAHDLFVFKDTVAVKNFFIKFIFSLVILVPSVAMYILIKNKRKNNKKQND